MTSSVSNTTCSLIFGLQFALAHPIRRVGIPELYATKYVTSTDKQQMRMYYCLGQQVPSMFVSIPLCHAASLVSPMADNCKDIIFTVLG